MRCVVLTGNRQLEVKDRVESPLDIDSCRVRIDAAGVCSTDIHRGFEGGAYSYPLVMGHELAGTIVDVGASTANKRRLGEKVTIFPLLPCFHCEACIREAYMQCRNYDYYGSRRDGGFAEQLDIKSWNLIPVPEEVLIENAALTEPTSVVVHALTQLGVLPNPPRTGRMVILGAGFLGLLATDLLRQTSPELQVTVIDRNKGKLDKAAELNARTILIRDQSDWTTILDRHEAEYALVLEGTGAPVSFAASTRLAAPNGRVVWMGNISSDLILPANLVSQILRKELHIQGSWNSTYSGEAKSDWTHALELMRQGFGPSRYVSRTIDLDGLPQTLHRLHQEKLDATHESTIKVMVKPNPAMKDNEP